MVGVGVLILQVTVCLLDLPTFIRHTFSVICINCYTAMKTFHHSWANNS